jgi:hypothetical protein
VRFRARYGGTCAECLGPVHAGELIEGTPEDGYTHVTCVRGEAGKRGPREVLCPQCHLLHAGECL